MAETVEVRGGGQFDGAILKNAASEATLQSILAAVKGKGIGGGAGTGDKINKLYEKALQTNISSLEESTKKHGLFEETLEAARKETGKLTDSFTNVVSSFTSFVANGVLTTIEKTGSLLINYLSDGLEAYREASSVGASFNGSLKDITLAAANASMPLDSFTKMIEKNSTLMAALGGTVTQGAESFARLSKDLRTGKVGEQLYGMGLTMDDINDYLGSYLELQLRTGKLNQKLGSDERAGTVEYIQQLDQLSKATGLSRKQLLDGMNKISSDGRLLTISSRLAGDALKNFQAGANLATNTFDPQTMNSISNAMSGITDPTDKFGMYLGSLIPDFRSFNKSIGEGKLSLDQQIDGYKKQDAVLTERLKGMTTEQIAADENLRQLALYQASLKKLINANTAQARRQQSIQDKVTIALSTLGQTFQDIKSNIEVALLESGVFDMLSEGMEALSDQFLKIKDQIGPFFKDFIKGFESDLKSGGIIDAVSNAFSKLFDVVAPIVSNLASKFFRSVIEGLTGASGKRKELEERKATLTKSIDKGLDRGRDTSGQEKELLGINDELSKMDAKNPMTEALDAVYDKVFSLKNILIGGTGLVAVLGGLWAAFALAPASLAPFAAGVAALANPASLVGLGALTLALMGMGKALGYAAPAFEPLGNAVAKVLGVLGETFIGAINAAGDAIQKVFGGIKGVIDAWVAGFKAIPDVLSQLSNLDAGKLGDVGKALGPLSGSLLEMGASAGLMALFGPDGLIKLADALGNFGKIDENKLTAVAPALKNLHESLKLFTGEGGGIISSISSAFGNWLKGDSGVGAFADSFKKFNDIDGNNLKTLVTSIGDIKTTIGDDFGNQAKSIDTFAASIRHLNKDIGDLNASLKSIASEGKGLLGGGKSNLEVITSAMSQATGAGTASTTANDKLNTQLDQMIVLTTQIRDNNKDLVDAVRGRGNAL
jgi:hypothetical protein